MSKHLFRPFAAIALIATALPLHGQEVQPVHAISFNGTVTSDYRYRGISQTRLQPALQGGADYTHSPGGLYAGTWLSTIMWTKDAGGNGDMEWDVYAGKRGQLFSAVSYDAGVLGYVYPANGLKAVRGFANANTAELYGQIGYGPAYAKYSMSLTNLFGFVDSRHSGYLDIGANFEMDNGLTLNLHVGHQDVRHGDVASYTDYKFGASRDLGVATLAVALVGTNASETAYASPADGRFLGRKAIVISVGKTL